MTRLWKWAAAISLGLVVALSLFGKQTYVELENAKASVSAAQTQMAGIIDSLVHEQARLDTLRHRGDRVETVYRDRVKTLPPDTVLVNLPAECGVCAARSRQQDIALALADSTIAVKDSIITGQNEVIVTTHRDLLAASADLAAAQDAVARAAKASRRTILGVPLPEVMAGYGLSFSDGQVRQGPVVALGWRISL